MAMFISPPDPTIRLPKLTNVAEPRNVFKTSQKSREKRELLPPSASSCPLQGKIVLHRHLCPGRFTWVLYMFKSGSSTWVGPHALHEK